MVLCLVDFRVKKEKKKKRKLKEEKKMRNEKKNEKTKEKSDVGHTLNVVTRVRNFYSFFLNVLFFANFLTFEKPFSFSFSFSCYTLRMIFVAMKNGVHTLF